MRIAQIAPPWIAIPPHTYGGTENVIYHLVEELVALGHDVTLLAPGDAYTSARQVSFIPQSLVTEGVPWEASLKAYYHLHKSMEYVIAHEFDIVHTHLSSSGDMYLFPLSASLTTPHITTLHSHFPFDKGPEQWIGDADTHFMDWSTHMRFVAISESARYHQRVPINFIGMVHHGIPVEAYYDPTATIEDAFVWIGQITPEKGVHLAIEAARQADVPLILAGVKNLRDREAMYYYHHMVEPYIDGNQIRYIGPVDIGQKLELLNRARGFLNPIAWEEPFGMVMIEAMACGCPVISLRRGAASELIVHGKTGFLVNTVEEMVKAIHQIDAIDRTFVRHSTEYHFSARTMAENYLRIYRHAIATSTRTHITEPLEQQARHALAAGENSGVLTI